MKTIHKKHSKIIYLWVPLLIIVCASIISYGVYALFIQPAQNTPIQSESTTPPIDNPTTDEEKATGENIKEQSITQEETPSDTLDVHFTALNQTSASLQVRAIINEVLSTGICTLTATRSGYTTVEYTADIQASANSTTCKGFDVPLSQLQSGVWRLTLSVTTGDETGVVEQDVTIE